MASPYDNIPGKIFIGGISPLTSQESIQKYFSKFGDLSDCVLMQDKSTGKSRGFGFVTYKDSRAVDDVLSKPHIIDGKEVDCKRAIPRDQQNETTKEEPVYKTKKLFVGGIPQNTTDDEFRNYFEGFGEIEDSVIMVDKETGKSRGFGFVTFDSEDAVDKVINKYYDNKIGGKWVECKRAQPKELNTNSAKKATPSKQLKDNGQNSNGFTSTTTNSQPLQTSTFQNSKTVQTPQKNQKFQQLFQQDSYGKNTNGDYPLGSPDQLQNDDDGLFGNQNGLSTNSQSFSPFSYNSYQQHQQQQQQQESYSNEFNSNSYNGQESHQFQKQHYSDTNSSHKLQQSPGQNSIFTFSNQLPSYFNQSLQINNSQYQATQNQSYGQGQNNMKGFTESSNNENGTYQESQNFPEQNFLDALKNYGMQSKTVQNESPNMKLRETSRFANTAVGSDWSWNNEIQWK